MAIKSLLGWSVEAAHAGQRNQRCTTPGLRRKVLAEARSLLGEGPVLEQLEQLLKRCEDLIEQQRNDVLHGLWAKAIDGGGCSCGTASIVEIPPIEALTSSRPKCSTWPRG